MFSIVVIKYPEKKAKERYSLYHQTSCHSLSREVRSRNQDKNLDASQAMVAHDLIPAIGRQSQANL